MQLAAQHLVLAGWRLAPTRRPAHGALHMAVARLLLASLQALYITSCESLAVGSERDLIYPCAGGQTMPKVRTRSSTTSSRPTCATWKVASELVLLQTSLNHS